MGGLVSQRSGLMPVLLDRLGDAKDTYRASSSQAFYDAWPASQTEVEKVIREGAILGSNVRAKVAGMQWVTKVCLDTSPCDCFCAF